MNIKKLLLLCFVILFVLNACKKSGVTPSTTGVVDIYVVGYTSAANGNAVATYWKNGVATRLTDSLTFGSANAIVANGKDIYIAGTITPENGRPTAVYWKNGIKVELPDVGSGYANAIAVSGNDIYVAGNTIENNYDYTATYWKNGTEIKLPDVAYSFFANGIAVKDNNVYVCGNDDNPGALYWKNDTVSQLSGIQAFGITLNNNDVYIAGFSGPSYYATYWKNGTAVVVDNSGIGQAKAIVVNGNDVYVAGQITNNNIGSGTEGNNNNVMSTPCYWKNGTVTKLPATNDSYANAIAVFGNDVYVAGFNASSVYNTFDQAAYWKNGTLVTLNQGNSGASGIAIVSE